MLLVGFANHVPNAERVAVDCDVRPSGESTAATVAALLGDARAGGRHRLATGSGTPGARAPRARWSSWTRRYLKMRAVKSREELDHLRYAAWLTDRSAAALIEAAVPGATELDLVDAVESSYGGTGRPTTSTT